MTIIPHVQQQIADIEVQARKDGFALIVDTVIFNQKNHVELGKTILQATTREFAEKTGLEIDEIITVLRTFDWEEMMADGSIQKALDYYMDLVFYHKILKCFVLIDLKIDEVDHADIGQMNMYLNYFKTEENMQDDNEPAGIILSAEKNDIKVEYA